MEKITKEELLTTYKVLGEMLSNEKDETSKTRIVEIRNEVSNLMCKNFIEEVREERENNKNI